MQIEMKNISKSFSKQEVLTDINLCIQEKEIFGLIGPSGSGKTTLIRLMTGAINANKGKVTIGDQEIPNINVLKTIGYMPQNDALYTDLSGLDNLRFFGRMYEMKKEELDERIKEVLEFVDLLKDSRKKVQFYSGGMKKRLSLAAALLHKPGVLFLDEPTVGIDPILRKRIWEQLELIKQQGTTIIVSTHVMDEASKCDRLALIYHGTLIDCDTVENLLNKTENRTIEELFLKKGEVD